MRPDVAVLTVVCALSALAVMSCGTRGTESEVIHRLDRYVADYDALSEKARIAGRDSLATGLDLYLMYNGESVDDADAALRYMSHTPAVVVFSGDVAERVGDLAPVEALLGSVRDAIGSELPAARFTGLYGVVSANPYESVVVSDTTVLIALNHYLGTDYPGYSGMPEYRRRVKTIEFIPVDVAEAVMSVAYPYEPADDERLLNRMLYDGAVLYAMHRVLPGLSLSQLTGWTEDEVAWLRDNEAQIYGAVIERDLLYSTSEDDMRRLLDPSPVTTLIHAGAPGRAGRYIGYRIAEAYASRNDGCSPLKMLDKEWYNSPGTLAESGYTVMVK